MSKDIYPILVFPIHTGLWMGVLVHQEEVQALGSSPDQVRKTIQKRIDNPVSNQMVLYPSRLKEARLRFLQSEIYPALEIAGDHRPYPYRLPIQVPVVYGPTEHSDWCAYIPWIYPSEYSGRNWKHLWSYLHDLVPRELSDWPAEKLHRYALMDPPTLKVVAVKPKKKSASGKEPETQQWVLLDQMGRQEPESPRSLQAPFAWEREREVSQIAARLQRLEEPLVIIGDSGMGKSRILRQALKQVHSQMPEKEPLRCWRMDSRRIVASTKYMGEWQAKVDQIVEQLDASQGILWLDDLTESLKSGGAHPENSLGAYLIHFLGDGRLRLIAESTPEQWDRVQQWLPAFADLFYPYHLDDLSQQQLRNILDRYAAYIRQNQNVQLTLPAREEAMRLLSRYMPYERFPGKAMHFLEQSIQQARQDGRKRIGPLHIIRQFATQSGLPELFLRDDLSLDQPEITRFFQSRIIGQEEVVERLSEVIKIFKAGLNNPYKPITSLVFAGPTGVGKTASTQALADFFFGREGKNKTPLIRLDMSEFQHAGDIDRLIGNEYDPSQASLARQVRERLFSVILLDEIEKAAPPVFDTLLNILDEGRLVDAFGRVAHFRNSIIIMTTNLGSTSSRSIGFQATDDHSSRYEAALRNHFRPEFLNRIDDFVFFHPLRREDLRRIAMKELEALNRRDGLRLRGLRVHFQEALVDWISQVGFDEELGARPLQRTIEEWIVTPLAAWLIQHPELRQADLDIGLTGQQTLHIREREAGKSS